MGHYAQTGKEVLFYTNDEKRVSLAQASDEDMAGTIVVALNQRSSRYIPEAVVTLSPYFHGDMVSDHKLRSTINDAIDVANRLDKIKKSLFYGRDNNLIVEGEADVSDIGDKMPGLERAEAIDIIHGILGKFTEAGELLELLKNCYNGETFDFANLSEEIGDGFWYDAILCNVGDMEFEEIQRVNIHKLRSRFPDKFTKFDANNRNLAVERAILEGGDLTLAPTMPVSGPEAVEQARLESEAAFKAVKNVGSAGVDAPVTTGTDISELAKSPAARAKPFPDEHIARQKVRPEDLD